MAAGLLGFWAAWAWARVGVGVRPGLLCRLGLGLWLGFELWLRHGLFRLQDSLRFQSSPTFCRLGLRVGPALSSHKNVSVSVSGLAGLLHSWLSY